MASGLGDMGAAARALVVGIPREQGAATPGGALLFFPLIGLAIGAVAAVANVALQAAHPRLRGVFVAAVLAGAGGAAGLRSFARAVQHLWAGRVAGSAAAGWAGAAGAFALKAWAIASLSPSLAPALLFAPMLGRWAMVVCAYGARDAARPGTGARFHREIGFREFAWASALALGLLLGTLEAVGVVVAVAAAGTAVALRLFWHRRRGGVNWDMVAATGEVAETAALVVLFSV